jgi:hypothetical protein
MNRASRWITVLFAAAVVPIACITYSPVLSSGDGGNRADPGPGAQSCDGSVCVAANVDPLCANAAPGQRVCDGATVVQCSQDLGSHSQVEACVDQKCVAGGCTGVCVPGVVPCATGTGNQTCDGQGRWTTGSCTLAYTGGPQSWIVPAGVTKVTVEASGAGGGGKYPGEGGSTTASIVVTPGETLSIFVGGQGDGDAGDGVGGFNGGGPISVNPAGTAGGGGGATDVRQGGGLLDNRIVVAGGGGGSGANTGCLGGNGGGLSGQAATTNNGGGGGTQYEGGVPGQARYLGIPGPGVLGSGGQGANNGGGGGGGYYGGGGGANPSAGCNGGGGGGSSFATTTATGIAMQTGVVAGNGQVIIHW